MTPSRRTEVNRRLAEFEDRICREGHGEFDSRHCDEFGIYVDEHPHLCEPDYTADLSAVVRLEGKLPPHEWSVYSDGFVDFITEDGFVLRSVPGPTEAEARAEAICQWLESRAGEASDAVV